MDSYRGFNEETSEENRLKKYWGITKLRDFLWHALHGYSWHVLTLIAVFSTLRLWTLCTFSHEPPHIGLAGFDRLSWVFDPSSRGSRHLKEWEQRGRKIVATKSVNPYSKIGCRRTHVLRGQARRSYLQAAFLSRSYLVQCRMYWAKVSQNADVLRSGWDVLVISGWTFFGKAFFDVRSYCSEFQRHNGDLSVKGETGSVKGETKSASFWQGKV